MVELGGGCAESDGAREIGTSPAGSSSVLASKRSQEGEV